MSTDVREYLNKKGLQLKEAGSSNVHCVCPFCHEDAGKRGRLYVNVDPNADIPGLYQCKLCDAHGSLVSLQKFFGDATDKQEKEDTGYLRRAIFAAAADYYHQALEDHVPALKWLFYERGLSIDTIEAHKLGYADGGVFKHLRASGFAIDDIAATGLTTTQRDTGRTIDFLQDHITIPYMVAGTVVMIRGRAFGPVEDGRKYVTGPGQKARLFNTDLTWGAEEVVCAEGELDAMVLEQLGYNAVAVPGANTWQDSWDGYFADCRRVWVVFDRDENDIGGKGATKVLDHLGPKGRKVELPPHDGGKSKNDITEYIVVCNHSGEEFDKLLRSSRGALLTVKDAVDQFEDLQGKSGLKFGIKRLDQIISPGILSAQLAILLAKTGAGKTIALLNLFHRVCVMDEGAKILFLSLEQTRGDWWERARRIYRFFNEGSTDEDAYKFWSTRIWMDDRNRVTPGDFEAVFEDFVYEVGQKPTLVGVDYLGYWAQSFKGDRYERTSDAMMALKGMAKDHEVPIIAPHQVSRMTTHGTEPAIDNARDSGVVEETADFIMMLWSQDTMAGRTATEQTGQLTLKVGKSRHGGVGHTEPLQFGVHSLVMVTADDGKDLKRNAQNEIFYRNTYPSETWEQVQIRHQLRTPQITSWKAVEAKWEAKRLQDYQASRPQLELV